MTYIVRSTDGKEEVEVPKESLLTVTVSIKDTKLWTDTADLIKSIIDDERIDKQTREEYRGRLLEIVEKEY